MVLELYGKKARLRLMALMYSGILRVYPIDDPISILVDDPTRPIQTSKKWLSSNE